MTTLIDIIAAIKDSPFYQAPVISALIAALLAIWGIRTQRSISRQKNSLDFESAYKRNDELIAHNFTIVKFIQDVRCGVVANRDQILEKLASAPNSELSEDEANLAKSIATILNEWERTANATFSGLYDDNYLYRAHGTAIIQIYSSFKRYIEKRQETNPRLFINFTMLSVSWGMRRCKEDSDKLSSKIRRQLLNISQSGVNFLDHTVQESIDGHTKSVEFSVKILHSLISKRKIAYLWYCLRSKIF